MSFASMLAELREANAQRTRLSRRKQTVDVQRQLREVEMVRKRVEREVDKMVKRLATPGSSRFAMSVMRKVQGQLNAEGWPEQIIKRRFERESIYAEGPKWKPLKQSTIRKRIREGYGPRPILQNTGRLRGEAIRRVHRALRLGSKGGISVTWRVGKMTTPYAKYVHRVRPFLRAPTPRELRGVVRRMRVLVGAELRRQMRKGKG